MLEAAVVAVLLAPAAYVDLRELRIPDWSLAAAALLGLGKRLLIGPPLSWWVPLELAAGFAFFALLLWLAPDKLGFGDAKLSAVVALLLGAWRWVLALLGASLVALVVFGVLAAAGRATRQTPLPFAPFVAAAAAAAALLPVDPLALLPGLGP